MISSPLIYLSMSCSLYMPKSSNPFWCQLQTKHLSPSLPTVFCNSTSSFEVRLESKYLSRYSDGLQAGRPGFDSWQNEVFSPPQHPHRFWGQPYLLSNGYRGHFPGGKAAGMWSWPLTTI
jgi:hypothetical protein